MKFCSKDVPSIWSPVLGGLSSDVFDKVCDIPSFPELTLPSADSVLICQKSAIDSFHLDPKQLRVIKSRPKLDRLVQAYVQTFFFFQAETSAGK